MEEFTKTSEPRRFGTWSHDRGSGKPTPEAAGISVAAEAQVRGDLREAATDDLAHGETVLVVDDEPMVRELVGNVLRQSGYRVLEAATAGEAQRLAADGDIDLLLTDFAMPVTNGLELARWFQRNHPKAKVLIITGSLWELANQVGEQEEVTILPKPFEVAQLKRMVRLVLGQERL